MYTWVPAGAVPCGITRAYVYIRYGKTGIFGIEPKSDKNKKTSWIKTPDRDIYICLNQDNRPLDENFDECLNTSFYDDEGLGTQLEYALMSAHNAIGLNLHDRDFISDGCKVKLLLDSGGAQLKLGTSSYVDPDRVIKCFNEIADIGAALDIPPRPCDHISSSEMTPVLKALAFAQKKNNTIFIKEKREDLKLLNVAHGFVLNQTKEWCKLVDEPENFYGWAAGADNISSVINSLQNILVPFKYHKGEMFHLFGVSGRSLVPALAWMGKYINKLTTDSTAYLQAVRIRAMLMYNSSGDLDQVQVGKQNRAMHGVMTPIPCNCPVCSRLKYMDLYALDPEYFTAALLCTHNLMVLLHYTKSWNNLAQNSTLEEYLNVINTTLRKRNGGHIAATVAYVDAAINGTLEEAAQQFPMLMGDAPMGINNSSLPSEFWATSGDQKKRKADVTGLTSLKSAAVDTLPQYLSDVEMKSFGL